MITAPVHSPDASTMLLHVGEAPAPALSPSTRERLQQAGQNMWRVVEPQGRVLGHLSTVAHPLGNRFMARRYCVAAGRFRDVGEFWSADDAVACLRHAG